MTKVFLKKCARRHGWLQKNFALPRICLYAPIASAIKTLLWLEHLRNAYPRIRYGPTAHRARKFSGNGKTLVSDVTREKHVPMTQKLHGWVQRRERHRIELGSRTRRRGVSQPFCPPESESPKYCFMRREKCWRGIPLLSAALVMSPACIASLALRYVLVKSAMAFRLASMYGNAI